MGFTADPEVKNPGHRPGLLRRKKPLGAAVSKPPLAIPPQPVAVASWLFPVNQEAASEAQRRIVEQAYTISIYTPKIPSALSNRVTDAVFSPLTGMLDLFDA